MVSVTTLKQVALAAVALGTCSVAAPASALTLTFDNAPTTYTDGAYQESGFEFNIVGSNVFLPHFGDGIYQPGTLNWHNDGDNGSGAVARLTKIGGGTFDFAGLDLVGSSAFPFTVTSNLGNLLDVNSLGSVIANWTGVSYVDFGVPSAYYAYVGIDNVVADAAAVPTPALLPGLVGMGIAALRKRKGAVQAESTSEA